MRARWRDPWRPPYVLAGITGLWMLGLFGKRMPWPAIVAFGAGFAAVGALSLEHLEFQLRAHPDPAVQLAALIRLAGPARGPGRLALISALVEIGRASCRERVCYPV